MFKYTVVWTYHDGDEGHMYYTTRVQNMRDEQEAVDFVYHDRARSDPPYIIAIFEGWPTECFNYEPEE